jgi:hypothetical protein
MRATSHIGRAPTHGKDTRQNKTLKHETSYKGQRIHEQRNNDTKMEFLC